MLLVPRSVRYEKFAWIWKHSLALSGRGGVAIEKPQHPLRIKHPRQSPRWGTFRATRRIIAHLADASPFEGNIGHQTKPDDDAEVLRRRANGLCQVVRGIADLKAVQELERFIAELEDQADRFHRSSNFSAGEWAVRQQREEL